ERAFLPAQKTLEIDHYQPFLGQRPDRVRGALAGVPRILDPAVRHLAGTERRRLVDRDPTELELLGGAQRGLDVSGEDPGLEAVTRPVRELNRLVDGADRIDRADGPEDLLAADLQLRGGVGEDCRTDQLAVRVASCEHAGSACACLFDPAEDPFAGV